VPVRLVLPAVPEESSSLYLVVSVTNPAEFTDTVRFRVRRPEAPRMETFISAIDGSCQYYGILYPKDYDRSRRYGLILSLHGAGCEASGQVEAYRPKDWAFVVAPTNRRPYGFDWQDWGRLDALEVLDLCLGKLPIDPERVLLTGHSMGGHGTWHVGLAHPDRFAALAPCAGWPSFQLYIPWFLQRSETFAEPDQLAVRDRALAPDNVPALLPNALNLPVFILHGADDDNVPTFHGRSFAGWLSELRYDYQYKEVPNRSHWWQYEAESLSVIDDADLMAFLAEQRRNPGPRHIRFRTADLGQSNRAYWMTIERVRTVGRMAEIEAWAEDTLVRVRTRNIAQLSLDLDERLFFRTTAAIEIDGQNLGKVKALPAHIVAHRDKGQWRLGPARAAGRRKVPGLYGPAKQAMFRPFVIAYGTQDPALTNFLGHAAAQEAMRWWQRANGLAEVIPDTEVTREHVEQYNIVLYGGPGENSYTRRISPGLPIRVSEGQMFLDDRKLGSSLACLFVFPNPDNPDRLVLVRMGTDPASTRLSMFWGLVYSGAGVPDFMVWDTGVRRLGWAGVRAAGFFDPFWRLDPVSTWIQE
ncbi:MAG: prolyl oligopeptidase family serine peptidase, partial [candidate division WOR-3 bacterium]